MKHLAVVFSVLILASLVYAAPVTQDQAQTAAQKAAESIWGSLNTVESTLLLNPDGSAAAYGFIYGRNGITSLDFSIVEEGYNLRGAGFIDQGWEVARAAEVYAYAIVAVDDNYGPVLEMCDGLPSYLTHYYDVLELGAASLSGELQIS
ncbi:MAG: hypothetical protein ABH878_01395, partial [bacterium]